MDLHCGVRVCHWYERSTRSRLFVWSNTDPHPLHHLVSKKSITIHHADTKHLPVPQGPQVGLHRELVLWNELPRPVTCQTNTRPFRSVCVEQQLLIEAPYMVEGCGTVTQTNKGLWRPRECLPRTLALTDLIDFIETDPTFVHVTRGFGVRR
mgnify:CR=1 FL=1